MFFERISVEVHASRKHVPRIRTQVCFQTGVSRPGCPQTGHEVPFVRLRVDPATSLRHFSWLERDSCAPGRLLQARNLASKAEEANSVLPADTVHLSTLQQYSQGMCFLSIVTNCHKLSGLKLSRFIILKFWRSEVWKALFLQAALVGNLFSYVSQLPGAPSTPWLVAPSSRFRACVVASRIPPTLLPSSTSWDPCDRAQLDKPGSSTVSGSLIHDLNSICSLDSPLPCKVMCS